MAKARRRSTRNTGAKSPSPVASRANSSAPPPDDEAPPQERNAEVDNCPACEGEPKPPSLPTEKENWIRCDACKAWYHWRCAGNGGDVEAIDKWFCTPCIEADPTRTITLKAPARKSSRKRTQRDYANLNSGLGSERDPHRWTRILEGKSFMQDRFKRMKGSDVGIEWLEEDESAMSEPIVIEVPEGLGMKMPDPDFTVDDVAETVGEEVPVEVIDVASQSTSPGWTLGKWAEYYDLEPSAREKILNVISLEVSGTPLADMILPPRIVRELDWVENFWPNTRKGKGHQYPKVQLYCLMGVANAWTDWHIDFAGSSVYYHILQGSKVFYFIRPTPSNLAAYERWSGSDLQTQQWLGDLVDEVIKVELTAGNTMIIPTGWIHAVYTPMDTLVFGGNFLHSYNVATQLKVRQIEIATHVPKKFRFPMFSKLCWYVGDKYLRDLKSKDDFPQRVLESLEALAGFLVSEARLLEKGGESVRREAKEQVPSDRVKDAPAMAREFRWRVKQALGVDSETEAKGLSNGHGTNGAHSRKRPRSASVDAASSNFRNFRPRAWDKIKEETSKTEPAQTHAVIPAEGVEWAVEGVEEGEKGLAVEKRTRQDVVVKVRRTEKGLERERTERLVEEWSWD
ncbi:hypothetical protein HGRIS_013364 [Hohenbuehelia grisea]|uniref:JmjC domain-containing histone demethylation protein 1 n=1 Tax=Hohenbuehelia grisea TaxID=104357 RepID=A0ABR3IVE0_9AGAR